MPPPCIFYLFFSVRLVYSEYISSKFGWPDSYLFSLRAESKGKLRECLMMILVVSVWGKYFVVVDFVWSPRYHPALLASVVVPRRLFCSTTPWWCSVKIPAGVCGGLVDTVQQSTIKIRPACVGSTYRSWLLGCWWRYTWLPSCWTPVCCLQLQQATFWIALY